MRSLKSLCGSLIEMELLHLSSLMGSNQSYFANYLPIKMNIKKNILYAYYKLSRYLFLK